MSDDAFSITSSRGTYNVVFRQNVLGTWEAAGPALALIDRRVLNLYSPAFGSGLAGIPQVAIDADEATKSLSRMEGIIAELLAAGVRRNSTLLAIGGGITQDITSFLATLLFRGISWEFIPTTLLAQTDSCIGSKSSINAAGVKNLVGTFLPPRTVLIDCSVLATLDSPALHSGIGEMLKVHAISGPDDFDRIAADYPRLLDDEALLRSSIRQSLLYKKELIELDEFDTGPRNVMNYGHSFGHAIETATDYAIPHGIAVTIGMDMANFVAQDLGLTTPAQFARMHPVLRSNAADAAGIPLDARDIVTALRCDKKNTSTQYRLVLPNPSGRIGLTWVDMDAPLESAIDRYLAEARSA